jgi:hypothetical protein
MWLYTQTEERLCNRTVIGESDTKLPPQISPILNLMGSTLGNRE